MSNHLTKEQKAELGMDQKTIRALSTRLANARHRCYMSTNPNHIKHYRDKGIRVCDEWLQSRFAFLKWAKTAGYESGLELDRIDNSKGYEPSNCRFVDVIEGRRNRTTARSFDEKNAVRILREHGFSEVFIAEHFPTK